MLIQKKREIVVLLLQQAVAESQNLKRHNADATTRYKVPRATPPVDFQKSAAQIGKYRESINYGYRVEIRYEDGEGLRTVRCAASDLVGCPENIDNVKNWLTSGWKKPDDVVMWRMIENHASSRKVTSGWIITAEHVGEIYDPEDPMVSDLHRDGRTSRQFGPYVLFESDNPQAAASGSALQALRIDTDGTPRGLVVSDKDVVLNKAGKVVFRGDNNTSYGLVVPFAKRPTTSEATALAAKGNVVVLAKR